MAYQPSWLELGLGAIVDRAFGGAVGKALDRVSSQFSPVFRLVRGLEARLANPAGFGGLLVAAPGKDAWNNTDMDALVLLDEKLAATPGREAALNRASLHGFLTRRKMWRDFLPCNTFEERNEELTARLYSGYLQLMRHGEGALMQERVAEDFKFFLCPTNYALQSGYSHATHALMDTAQNRPDAFQNWKDEDVLRYCAPLVNDRVHDAKSSRWDIRFINPDVLARYVQLRAAQTGNLDEAAGILARLPATLDYRHAHLGVYKGMVEAARQGTPVLCKDKVMARELQKLLKAADPWQALGRRMVTLRGDARAVNPLRNLARLDLIGRPMQFLGDGVQNALFAGINEGLRSVMLAKKRGATMHIIESLRQLDGHAKFHDMRDMRVKHTLFLPRHERGMALVEQKIAVRSLLRDAFTRLVRNGQTYPQPLPSDRVVVDCARRGMLATVRRLEPTVHKPAPAQISRIAASLVL